MPNHVSNLLSFDSMYEDIFQYIKGTETLLDFNKIFAMPKQLKIESGSLGEDGMEYLLLKADPYFQKEVLQNLENKLVARGQLEEAISLGKQYLINIAETGYTTWYGWCNANWGTKWNAYSVRKINDNTIMFDTAWCGVQDLMIRLSLQFPSVAFAYAWADEDVGSNLGRIYFKNGEIFVENISTLEEKLALYLELHPEDVGLYVIVDGSIKYIEEED